MNNIEIPINYNSINFYSSIFVSAIERRNSYLTCLPENLISKTDSLPSDLALVKPIAIKMFNIKGKDSEKYFKEVENKLTEETNYILEIEQSKAVVEACEHIPNLKFPSYYEEFSCERIITMDYMKGEHLSEFVAHNTDQEKSNKLGQALWDFYMFQIHTLKKVHADPHPGNFLISENTDLIALDFGCMKTIPHNFYIPYFELADKNCIGNPQLFTEKLYELEILRLDDSKEEIIYFTKLFLDHSSVAASPLGASKAAILSAKMFLKSTGQPMVS